MEWHKIDVNICNSASYNVFKRVTRPEPNQVFNVDSSEGLKFLTRIGLRLNHLVDHKFRHNFQGCVDPVCSYGQNIETSTYFLSEKVKKINSSILKKNDKFITKIFLFGG